MENAPSAAPTSVGGNDPTRARAGYRPYLDGLRAVAVLAVLVYHLNRAWLPGGFLGVDVFFVLSGFLITTLLLDEHRETGRIHLPSFWARRIRRLMPALLVLLVVMAVAINLGGDVLAQGQARGDLLSTLFYVANWRFIASGQSYFAQYVAVSPDRHTWSLAIEEQFYLLWPIVVALVLGRGRRALAVVAGTVAAASVLAMVVLYDTHDPSRAYYGTDSRIFEILIGALLAIGLASRFRSAILRVGRVAAPIGLAVLLAAYALLADDNRLYYFGGALALSLAVAGLIAGLEGGSPIGRLLGLRPLVLVGLVSYGMYLWHFPVITFIDEHVGPTTTPALALVAVAVTAAITAASYVVVERPIRRRGQLIRYRLTPARLARVVPVASGAVAAIVLVSTIGGIDSPNWDSPVAGAGALPTIGRFGLEVRPGASPAGSALAAAGSSSGPTQGRAAARRPGSTGWTIGLVGDSVMESAAPGLEADAGSHGWDVLDAAHPACPVGSAPLYDDSGTISPYAQDCQSVRALHDQLIAAHPDVVIWHDLQSVLARRSPSGRLLLPGTEAWSADLFADWNRALNSFLDAGIPVVIVLPPLRSEQAPGCQGVPFADRCVEIQHQDAIIRAATTQWFASLGGRPDVHLIEVDSALCPETYPCPSSIDGLAVRLTGWDQTHFTDAGSRWFAPVLIDRVVAALE